MLNDKISTRGVIKNIGFIVHLKFITLVFLFNSQVYSCSLKFLYARFGACDVTLTKNKNVGQRK